MYFYFKVFFSNLWLSFGKLFFLITQYALLHMNSSSLLGMKTFFAVFDVKNIFRCCCNKFLNFESTLTGDTAE